MKVAVVSSKELGTECWLPIRFTSGACKHLVNCKRTCKPKCKAHTDKDVRIVSVTRVREHANGSKEILEEFDASASGSREEINFVRRKD